MASSPGGDIADVILHSTLEDGTRVCIRAIRPGDEALMREGIGELSDRSRYLRFFSVQPMPPDAVIDRLLDVDGHRHLGWGAIAVDQPGRPAIGAVHAVRSTERERTAEFSVAVVDAYQGVGLARLLVAVLLCHCRAVGIVRLDVQVLAENGAALGLVRALGGERCGSQSGVTEYVLAVEPALRKVIADAPGEEVRAVLAAMAGG